MSYLPVDHILVDCTYSDAAHQKYKGRPINKFQKVIILLIFKVLKNLRYRFVGNLIHFVGNLILNIWGQFHVSEILCMCVDAFSVSELQCVCVVTFSELLCMCFDAFGGSDYLYVCALKSLMCVTVFRQYQLIDCMCVDTIDSFRSQRSLWLIPLMSVRSCVCVMMHLMSVSSYVCVLMPLVAFDNLCMCICSRVLILILFYFRNFVLHFVFFSFTFLLVKHCHISVHSSACCQ